MVIISTHDRRLQNTYQPLNYCFPLFPFLFIRYPSGHLFALLEYCEPLDATVDSAVLQNEVDDFISCRLNIQFKGE